MVYARKLGDRTFTFLVSGKLWRNSMVMEDRETHTSWSHVLGVAILGKLKGSRLTSIPAVQTTWRAWFRDHPDTLLLKKDRPVTSSAYEAYFENPKRTGLFRAHWLRGRLPGKELVYGVAVGGDAVAVTGGVIKKRTIVPVIAGGKRVAVVLGRDGGIRAFLTGAPGKGPLLRPAARPGEAVDADGGRWDLDSGRCLGGPCRGRSLEPVQLHVAYWFAWSSFFPNTRVIDAGTKAPAATRPSAGR